MIKISVPTVLTKFTKNKTEVVADELKLGELTAFLQDNYPQLSAQILKADGSLNRYIKIFVNNNDFVNLDKDQLLTERDDIVIISAVAGG